MPLIFSKSTEGTVHKKPSIITANPNTIVASDLTYNMIDRLANSTKCGRCKGAK